MRSKIEPSLDGRLPYEEPCRRSNDIACLMIIWPEQRSLPAFYGVLYVFVSGGI